MKKVVVVLIILCYAIACMDRGIITAPPKVSFKNVGKTLTPEEEQAAKEAQLSFVSEMAPFKEAASRAQSTEEFGEYDQNVSTLGNYELVSIPYYRLDWRAFYNNPGPENIEKNLIKNDPLYIIDKQGDDIVFQVLLWQGKEKKGKWRVRVYSHNWDEVYVWLPSMLNDEAVLDYYVLIVGSREFMVLIEKDGPHYFYSTGEEITPERLSEFAVDYGNYYFENEDYMNELRARVRKETQEYLQRFDSIERVSGQSKK